MFVWAMVCLPFPKLHLTSRIINMCGVAGAGESLSPARRLGGTRALIQAEPDIIVCDAITFYGVKEISREQGPWGGGEGSARLRLAAQP